MEKLPPEQRLEAHRERLAALIKERDDFNRASRKRRDEAAENGFLVSLESVPPEIVAAIATAKTNIIYYKKRYNLQ